MEALALFVTTLLHSLWEAGISAIALFLLLRFIPSKNAHIRYALAALALSSVLFGGVITWARLAHSADNLQRPTITGGEQAHSEALSPTKESPIATSSQASTEAPSLSFSTGRLPASLMISLAWIWSAGCLVFLIRAGWSLLGAGRLRRNAQPLLLPIDATAILAALKMSGKKVEILVSKQISSPAVIGFLRPAVLLPVSLLTGAPVEYLRAVLAHEFAHIRRWDYLVNLVQMLLEAIFFFNPFVWWISAQMRREREACCDQIASAVCGDPRSYVEALSYVAESNLPVTALAASGTPGSLVDRAKRLLLPRYRPAMQIEGKTFLFVLFTFTLSVVTLMGAARVAVKVLSPEEKIEKILDVQRKIEQQNTTAPSKRIKISGEIIIPSGDFGGGRLEATAGARSERGQTLDSSSCSFSNGRVPSSFPFSLDLEAGRITVGAAVTGFTPVFLPPIDANDDISGIRIELKRGLDRVIVITDETGKRLPKIGVRAYFNGPFNIEACSGKSNEGGEFIILAGRSSSIPVKISIKEPGYEELSHRITNDRSEDYFITLKKAPEGRIRVIDKLSKLPIAGAEIVTQGRQTKGKEETVWGVPPLVSDAKGEAKVESIAKGWDYGFLVTAKGYSPAPTALNSEKSTVDVELSPPIILSGVIHADEEKSISLVLEERLRVSEYFHFDRRTEQTVALRPGETSFKFEGICYGAENSLRAGPLEKTVGTLTASLNGVVLDTRQNTREVKIRFEVPEGAPEARGVLAYSASITPIAGASQLSYRNQSAPIHNGRVSMRIPTPNELTLEPRGLAGYYFDGKSLPIPSAETPLEITVKLTPSGAITGRVILDDGNTSRVPDIQVISHPRQHRHARTYETERSERGITNRKHFVSTPLPLNETYTVLAFDQFNYALSEAIQINEREPIADVEIVMMPGKNLRLQFIDHTTGAVIPTARGSLRWGLPKREISRGAQLPEPGKDGVFHLTDVSFHRENELTVQWDFEGYVPGSQKVKKTTDIQRIKVIRGKELHGIIRDARTNLPLEGIAIVAVDATNIRGVSIFADETSDLEGRFRFTRLPNTPVTLSYYKDGKLIGTIPATPGKPIIIIAEGPIR